MPKISFLFPGHGAQYIGMGKEFYDTFEESRRVFQTANETLDFDLLKMCFEENQEIHQTEYTQAAIFTVSEAIRVVLDNRGIKPSVCAGLSLGEYNALVASGILRFEDTLPIVRKRGLLMEHAVPSGLGGMAAIFYLDSTIIEQVCKELNGVVQIANYNSPVQTVISGEKEAVMKACEKLKEAGAKKVVPLKVSGPFHSPMINSCGKELGELLKGINMYPSSVPYMANVTAEYTNVRGCGEDKVRELLVKQVSSPVLWKQSIIAMIEDGVDTFIEVGPGKTLSGLVKQIDRDAKILNVEKVSDLTQLEELLSVKR